MEQDVHVSPSATEATSTEPELPDALAAEFRRGPRHFPSFDGLRAIAAVSVLLLHTAWVSGFTLRSSWGLYTSRLEIGVSVFFLISGFLLYRPFALSHLSERPAPNVRRFWQRRFLRIVPAYWLALTVLTYGFGIITVGSGWRGFVVHYFFLQIYDPTAVFNGITQAWSLCTEVSFYLFLPLYAAVVGLRRRAPRQQLVWEVVGLAVLTAISYGFRWWFLHISLITVRNGKFVAICAPHCATRASWASLMPAWLPSYLDLFALGMLLAVVSVWFAERGTEPSWLRHRLMPWISWGCAAVCFWGVAHVVNDKDILYFITPVANIERQALYGAFAFFLLLPAVFGPEKETLIRRLLQTWPMVALGVISYGIYLWHLDLIDQFMKWTGWQPGHVPYGVLVAAVFGLSVAFASASYFGLERPLLRLKRSISWWDRRSGSGGSGAPDRAGPAPPPAAAPGTSVLEHPLPGTASAPRAPRTEVESPG
jgi:peptidoglycan/LPS O-acetylase OafA/YrhL